MNVDSRHAKKIFEILHQQNGTLFSSDLDHFEIPRIYLSILQEQGVIEKVSRGVYILKNEMEDPLKAFQNRYRKGIFSHGSALFLHGLSDIIPEHYSVTFPSGYNANRIKRSGHQVFFIKTELHKLGVMELKSPHGNPVRTYNLERTFCDLVRSRNKIESRLLNEGVKALLEQKGQDISLLLQYAGNFGIKNKVREYIEILL